MMSIGLVMYEPDGDRICGGSFLEFQVLTSAAPNVLPVDGYGIRFFVAQISAQWLQRPFTVIHGPARNKNISTIFFIFHGK